MENEAKIVYPATTAYVRTLLPKSEGYLLRLEEEAHRDGVPIIQPEVAQYMRVLMQLHRPTRILEIGAATGYSASVMALSLPAGEIDTIELNAETARIAAEHFEELTTFHPEVSVRLHVGPAEAVISDLKGPYDFVFIDAAKAHYSAFFEGAYPLVRPGGLIVSDNVLFRGMITDDALILPKYKTIVKRMRQYLEMISEHSRLTTSILSIGDGVALSYKREADGA